jgi:16S rRNA (guanine527-N7)-methyltransferase
MRELEAPLRRGLAELSLALDDSQVQQMLDYLALLAKWGRVYNLTGRLEPAEMLSHHLLDSLAIVKPLRRQCSGAPVRVLDVGAGAGLPGVVLAICCPDWQVDCVDAVAKKAAFLQQVAANLRLLKLRGLHARVEKLTDRYDLLTSRAFASLADFTQCSGSALADGGVWAAMKGKYPADEIAQLKPPANVFHVEPLVVPGLQAERCLVWLRRH